MALNLKNVEVEELATEVAALARESKTEAIRKALVERRDRLKAHGGKLHGGKDLRKYFEQNVWPMIPAEVLEDNQPRRRRSDSRLWSGGILRLDSAKHCS